MQIRSASALSAALSITSILGCTAEVGPPERIDLATGASNGTRERCYPQALYIRSAGMEDPADPDGPFCTGVLIAPDLVLTAAHCVVGENAAGITIGTGDYRAGDTGREVSVTAITQHPTSVTCQPDAMSTRVHASDLAVLRLSRPIEGITPAQIGTVAERDIGRYVGYGTANESGRTGRRRGVDLRIRDLDDDGMMTARTIGHGTCAGDSGGPLFAPGADCEHPTVVGILSGGEGRCGVGNDLFSSLDRATNAAFVADVRAGRPVGEPPVCCPGDEDFCDLPPGSGGVGLCAFGTRLCGDDARYTGMCQRYQASIEACDGAEDEDCDGSVDEGCMPDGHGGGVDCVAACTRAGYCTGELRQGSVICFCNAACPAGQVCDTLTLHCELESIDPGDGDEGDTCALDGICDPGERCSCDAFCCGGGGGGGGGETCTYDGGPTITYSQCAACGGSIEAIVDESGMVEEYCNLAGSGGGAP
jgi:hypothetical protein